MDYANLRWDSPRYDQPFAAQSMNPTHLPACDAHPSTSGGFGPRPSRHSCYLSEPARTSTSTHNNNNITSSTSRTVRTSAGAATTTATTATAVCQLSMPPPKKPKNGPTREEQFLSGEELRDLGQSASRLPTAKEEGKDEPTTTTMTRASSESPEPAASTSWPSVGSVRTSPATPLADGSVRTSPGTPLADGSGLSSWHRPSSGERPRKVPAKGARRVIGGSSSQPVGAQEDRSPHSPPGDSSPGPAPPPSSLRPVRHGLGPDKEPTGGSGVFSQPSASGRLIERLISERISTEVVTAGTVPGSAFREHQQRAAWPPRGLPTSPIGQPQVYSPDPRNPGLGYRLATSTAFASLVNQQPSWHPFDQTARGLNLRPSVGGIDIQGLQSAASFTVQQQQQHQHHQQLNQQQQRRRPILASLFSTNISAELTSPPSCGDDVFLHRSSSPVGLRPPLSSTSSSSYLSSVMRQASQAGMRASAALASAVAPRSGPAHRTESAPVYLHPAFQLPPSPTSNIRKNHSTSTLAPRASSPPSPGPPQSLPRHCINATTAAAAPALRQTKTGHELVLQALRGSSGNLISPTDTTPCSNGNGINNNNKNNHTINNNSKDIVQHSFRTDLNSSGANNNISSSSSVSSVYHSRPQDDGSTLLDLSLKGPSSRPADEEGSPMPRPLASLSRASVGSHGSGSSPPLPPPAAALPRRSSAASSTSPPRHEIVGRSPPSRLGNMSNSPTRSTPRHGSVGNSSGSPPPLHYQPSLGRGSPPSRQGSLESGSPQTPRRGSVGHNSPLSRQSSIGASSSPPPFGRKSSSLLTTLMEKAPSEIPRVSAGRGGTSSGLSATGGRVSPANSDDSNSYINVTSPVAPGSLLRAPSGSDSLSPPPQQPPLTSVMMTMMTALPSSSMVSPPSPRVDASPQQPQPHRTSELAGLLTQPPATTLAVNSSTSASTSLTSFSSSPKSLSSSTLASALLAVKKEEGASSSSSPSSLSVPYTLFPCKTESRRPSQDSSSR